MMAAAEKVATGLITYAARDSEFDGKPHPEGRDHGAGKRQDRCHLHRHHQDDLPPGTQHVQEGFQFITVISGCDVSEEDAERYHRDGAGKVPQPAWRSATSAAASPFTTI